MLAEKVVVVTGASRGIGRSIALEMARNGAKIVVNYAGNEQAASEVLQEIHNMGQEAMLYRANIGDADEVNEMMKAVQSKFGRIDILVNNAGITRDNLLMRMKEEEWDSVVDTNLKGVFLTTKAVSRVMMRQREGKIINISSVVGIMGNAGQANYVAAKAGVIGLTKSTARELAPRNIQVNAIAPGFIETDMTEKLPEGVKEEMKKLIPLGSFGQVEDIAQMAVFLASKQSNYITGQVIAVDGGMTM